MRISESVNCGSLDTCVIKYVGKKMQSSSLIGAFSVHDQHQSQQVLSPQITKQGTL